MLYYDSLTLGCSALFLLYDYSDIKQGILNQSLTEVISVTQQMLSPYNLSVLDGIVIYNIGCVYFSTENKLHAIPKTNPSLKSYNLPPDLLGIWYPLYSLNTLCDMYWFSPSKRLIIQAQYYYGQWFTNLEYNTIITNWIDTGVPYNIYDHLIIKGDRYDYEYGTTPQSTKYFYGRGKINDGTDRVYWTKTSINIWSEELQTIPTKDVFIMKEQGQQKIAGYLVPHGCVYGSFRPRDIQMDYPYYYSFDPSSEKFSLIRINGMSFSMDYVDCYLDFNTSDLEKFI